MRRMAPDTNRNYRDFPYVSREITEIITEVEQETGDPGLSRSIYIGPTALTFIRRLLEQGGSIITDTTLIAAEIDAKLLVNSEAKVICYIDDPQVIRLAEQRRVTRAEIAVDYGLAVSGPKLMVIGSAPAALNRILARRSHEPMSDVCVLATPAGFASVVQIKERLMEGELASIVVRGKKGGIPAAAAILNAILRQIVSGEQTLTAQ